MDMSDLSDWDVKRMEAENVKRMEAEKDVEGLIEVLRHGSRERQHLGSELRWLAAEALGRLGDAMALEPLIEALKGEDHILRWHAATALGEIGDSRAVECLIHVLGDEDQDVAKRAAEALGRIGDGAAVEHLIPFLKHDPRSGVPRKAAESLERLGWRPKDDAEKADCLLAKQEWNELATLGKAAVESLIWAMDIDDGALRHDAAVTLGKIGDPRAVKPLIRAWRADRDHWDQYDVRMALLSICDPAAVEPLIEALRGEGVSLDRRWLAAEALGDIGDARAVEPLIEALKDEDKDLCRQAAEALGDIGDPRALGPLIDALKDDIARAGYIGELAAVVAEALGDIGDERAVPALTEVLRGAKGTSLEKPIEWAMEDIKRKQREER
ncbi:MAG: HEAT repeat domain-containing protein [Chloroflexi bacterium]|nr:HEAT repeat domain-containing protein [Chloroflexota bacterium]